MREHSTRESFMRATGITPGAPCPTCTGYADAIDHLRGCPNGRRISNAEAIAAIRRAYGVQLATDDEIRAATRSGREQ